MSAKTRTRIAKLMLGIFFMGIFSALLHLSLVTHIYLEDGRIAELDSETGVPTPENEDGNPVDEGCPYLSEMTTARTLVSSTVASVFVAEVVDYTPSIERTVEVIAFEDTYRLSPSNSPPFQI